MTEKQTYWLADDNGDHALVIGADQRDQWIARGWAETDEPGDNAFVWARHEGIEQPARFPAGVFREVWSQKGWEASAPPDPVSPFNRDQGVAPAVTPLTGEVSSSPATSAGSKPRSRTQAAAGGEDKE